MTKDHTDQPLYRSLAAEISNQISAGELAAGSKLPTIRQFAKDKQVSVGTARHTYQFLADSGLISTRQGSGCYVACPETAEPISRKEQAIESIDKMLRQLADLDFSIRDIQILLELKLRQLEERFRNVRVAVVAESPEMRTVLLNSLATIPNVDFALFLLSNLREQPQRLEADFDFVVCEEKHAAELKLLVQGKIPVMQVAMTLSADTGKEIGQIPAQTKVGIISISHNFLDVMTEDFSGFVSRDVEAEIFLLGESAGFDEFLSSREIILMPPHCKDLISRDEEQLLKKAGQNGVKILRYDLRVDRGSWLYVADAAEQAYKEAKLKLNRR